MNLKEFPIIQVYNDEIAAVHKQGAGLSTISLVGMTAELLLREITDDARTGTENLIKKATMQRLITKKQACLFEEIRILRNKYIHVSADKIMDGWSNSSFYVDENGLLEHINEIVLKDFTKKICVRF